MEESKKMKKEASDLISDELFIVFGEDFSRHPHALEHLMRPLFPTNTFIWVETIGLRSPTFSIYDLKRIYQKILGWIHSSPEKEDKRKVPDRVHIVSPFMVPYNQFKFIRKFNSYQVKKSVDQKLSELELGRKSAITLASVPNAADYVGLFDEKLKVYFCVDEFSLWPGLDHKLVSSLEKDLIKKVDVIFATSETLTKTKRKKDNETALITHGVEFEHFNIGPKLKETRPYKFCYFGLFDERSNQDILFEISRLLDVEVHIIGNVVCDIRKIKDVPNIFFHGAVDYRDLPSKIKDMDAFILPYLKNELTQYINPLKLKEYLSTGRPVIATDLPEIVKLKEHLFVAFDQFQFTEIAEDLARGKKEFSSGPVISYVRDHETWRAKAGLFSRLISESLKRRGHHS